MAKGKIFEYAILYHPKKTKEQNELGIEPKSEVVQDIQHTLATSDKEVGVVAARAIPEKYLDKIEDIEIVMRPF
jgi:hypothetical protein